MNKRFLLIALVLLILGAGFFVFQNFSKVKAPQPAEVVDQTSDSGNVSVELSLKTPDSATGSAISINLPSGSDHCEVLKQALNQGKIQDLDMRYNEEFQTNGVFVINGIGKTDSPWWVYEINGNDAPAGCSQVKVAEGDKILWEYLGE